MKKTVLILFSVLFISLISWGQSTDFSYHNTSSNSCLPIEVQFTQTSTGTPKGYLWDFGNGTKSNAANPIITFTSAGIYTVRLITVYENNTAQRTRTISIHNSINASFTADRSAMCMPGTVNFTATNSGNLASYVWDFGDNSPRITGTANSVSHNYTDYGEFTVTLTANSTTGCSVSSSRTVKVIRPQISASLSTPPLGCVPMNSSFNAAVTLLPGSNVSTYSWNFGDGFTSGSASSTVSHTYNNAGSYAPTLMITTNDGCSSTYSFDTLRFGTPPTNNNAYPIDSVYCGSETPQFVSYSPNANRYDWDFGGGGIVPLTDTLAEHRYSTLGYKNITVTPVNNGCPGTPTSFRINIIGVIARFTYANTCSDKKTFQFNNTSQGHISTISWSLGNQAYSSNPLTVTHTYPQSGVFGVRLFISDNITGCIDTFKTRIFTANPILKNNDASICINSETRFSVQNNYNNPALQYTWNVLGDQIGPGTEAAPIVRADSLGHFNNNFVVLDNGPSYCPDTVRLDHPITVRGPKLDFTAPENICLNVPLQVTNLSHPYQPTDTIVSWLWNFGRPEYNDNAFQPQPFSYVAPKTYDVKLVAIDKFSCKDSLIKRVAVRPMPFLWIIPHADTLCQGQSAELIGYTSDEIRWAPANSNFCFTCDTTSITPVHTTSYIATSTNAFGCVSTDSAFLKVLEPFQARPLVPNTAICEGDRGIQLNVEPSGKLVVWTPGSTLTSTNIYNPVANPVNTTTYRATLTDSAGCFNSSADIIVTVNPKPTLDAGPDKILPYNTSYTLTPNFSSNISSWLWLPNDSLSCRDCPNPASLALTTRTYSVIATTSSGCQARDVITIFVECKGANILVPAAFTPNNDNRNDLIRPITRGIQTIKRFAVFNRQGQLMYEVRDRAIDKENYSWGWNGKINGRDQEQGAYVYFVEAVCDIGQTIFSKGSFILLR